MDFHVVIKISHTDHDGGPRPVMGFMVNHSQTSASTRIGQRVVVPFTINEPCYGSPVVSGFLLNSLSMA